jgi:hypothetical protein
MSEQVNARRTNRPKRVPLHDQRDTMNVLDRDPNYVYRWVNDVDNGQRVLKFQKGGYEVVQDKVQVGDPTVESNTNQTASVNEKFVGGNTKAILMRIPKEWYAEDQAAKQRQVDQAEATMRQENLGRYGDVRNAKLDITRNR